MGRAQATFTPDVNARVMSELKLRPPKTRMFA